jgi:hypothetical protein
MRRRGFLARMSALIAMWPLGSRARQRGRTIPNSVPWPENKIEEEAAVLSIYGYVEGKNVTMLNALAADTPPG